jgi:hypothetical protein
MLGGVGRTVSNDRAYPIYLACFTIFFAVSLAILAIVKLR